MKKIQQGILATALAVGFGLTSCSDDGPWKGSDSQGGIALELSTDGRVMRSTRADDNQCPIVPEAAQFAVNLTSANGSYSKNWITVQSFNAEKLFPMGDYTLTAYYGDKNAEGFELPYYEGKTDVHVVPGEATDVNVTATLANAMVSVRYTEAFTKNFKAWSAGLQSEGHDWVVMAQSETRPAFMNVSDGGKIEMSLRMTNFEGKEVEVKPANFEAKARHHYIITVNATGQTESGNLTLDIQFEDEVVAETVELNLGDDLFTSPAPTVTTKDFVSGGSIDKQQYKSIAVNPQFDLIAFGGFKEVNLTVESEDYIPGFGKSVQLVGASPLLQSQLAHAGVDVRGIFKNADKMAVVNVKKFVEQLPVGDYIIRVQAEDNMTRLSEMQELKVKVTDLDYTVQTDAFANMAVLKFETSEDALASLVNNVRIFNGASEVASTNIRRDATNGMVTVLGLAADTQYSAIATQLSNAKKAVATFTTEQALDVPNGNFEEQGYNLKIDASKVIDKIATGGVWKIALTKYQLHTVIDRYEPASWATVNAKTCYTGSKVKNTWFMVPSTFMENGAVEVRTVGYSHTGSAISEGNLQGTNYYNPYAPESLDVASGELFLGSYQFTGSENRSEGIAFTSRPTSVTFDYKYDSYQGDMATVEVRVVDVDGNVIGSKTVSLSAASTMKTETVSIDSYPFGKKAAGLYVCFRSSRAGTNPEVYKPTGEQLREPAVNAGNFIAMGSMSTSGLFGPSQFLPANNYKAVAVGSVLTVDNVKLGYGEVGVTKSAPRRNHKK